MSLTAQRLSTATYRETLRLSFGLGGYGVDYECVADPRVRVTLRRPTASQPAVVTIHVGAAMFGRGDWRGAAAALAAMGEQG